MEMDLKCVCYCITRNLYQAVQPSVHSMIRKGDPDGLFILAEDDDIGMQLPDWAEVINMSRQEFFRSDGPNYHKKWTYMAMMKTAMAKEIGTTFFRSGFRPPRKMMLAMASKGLK